MRNLIEIEEKIAGHQSEIATLLQAGARAAAEAGLSGGEVLSWLTSRGMSDADARQLCVDIIRERRGAQASPAAS